MDPTPQTVKNVAVTLGTDPSTWMTELVARTNYAIMTELAGD
jgi:hypothetical protein